MTDGTDEKNAYLEHLGKAVVDTYVEARVIDLYECLLGAAMLEEASNLLRLFSNVDVSRVRHAPRQIGATGDVAKMRDDMLIDLHFLQDGKISVEVVEGDRVTNSFFPFEAVMERMVDRMIVAPDLGEPVFDLTFLEVMEQAADDLRGAYANGMQDYLSQAASGVGQRIIGLDLTVEIRSEETGERLTAPISDPLEASLAHRGIRGSAWTEPGWVIQEPLDEDAKARVGEILDIWRQVSALERHYAAWIQNNL